MKTPLQQQMEGWRPGNLPQVTRSGASYQQVLDRTRWQLVKLTQEYHDHPSYDQTTQMIREEIDETLRRCHKYCIRDHMGAHYRESGLPRNYPMEFEHVLPVRVVREALLSGRLTLDQALNVPTCSISREKHVQLAQTGLRDNTSCGYWFWRRYRDLGIGIVTRQGEVVDLETWTLDDHYRCFESM